VGYFIIALLEIYAKYVGETILKISQCLAKLRGKNIMAPF